LNKILFANDWHFDAGKATREKTKSSLKDLIVFFLNLKLITWQSLIPSLIFLPMEQ
jgi:hypothetical protein